MTDLETLATLCDMPGQAQSKQNILAIADGAGLPATGFPTGDPSERWTEIMGRAMAAWGSVPTMASRGLFLPLQTDPGDPGDLSADQTPRPGFLSALGAGWFDTEREGATYATCFVTVRNDTAAPITFKAYKLTFEDSDAPRADGGQATYRNAADASIYVNLDGSVTINPGASKTLPLVADQIGVYGSTSAVDLITVLQTTTYGVLTITGSTKATGRDREGRDDYIARCLLAEDSNAPGGPGNAYRRAATTAKDKGPLQRYDGTGPVAITVVLVSPDSSTNEVTLIYAGPDGAVGAVDVLSANANILGVLLADPITGAYHNAEPLGVVPDTVVLLPGITSDPGGYGGVSATNQTIAVTYSVHVRAKDVPGGATPGTYTSGGSPPPQIAALFTAIAAALSAYLPSLGPGARDEAAGTGYVYTADIGDTIAGGAPGLYAPAVTVPATPTTSVIITHVPTAGTILGTIVVKP